MLKLISVIIVNYNAGDYLIRCVRSVLASDVAIEIFVVDNYSSDNSMQLLKKTFLQQKNLITIENNKNLGFSAANNQALRRTTTDFVLCLNPDTIVLPNTISQMQDIMQSKPEVGMAGCLIRNLDGSIQKTCVREIPTPWKSLVRVLHLDKLFPHQKIFRGIDLADKNMSPMITEVSAISGAFMLVRRTALEQVGLLDEGYFLYCEDIDWMMRFQQEGWKILFVPDVEIMHAKSFSARQTPFKVLWYKHCGMVRFYKKFFKKQYPYMLMWLVYFGIFLRLVFLLILNTMNLPSIFFKKSIKFN